MSGMKRLPPNARVTDAPSALGTTSSAAQPKAQAQIVSSNDTHGATAEVKARYICSAGEGLWVSAKQVGDARPDQRLRLEGSSGLALRSGGAWLDSHRNGVTCNGTWQTQT